MIQMRFCREIRCLVGIVGLVATGAVQAETAGEIVNRFEEQKLAALEAYLEANPEAEDRAEAEDALLFAYQQLGQNDKMADLLKGRLAEMPKGAELPPQEYFSTLQVLLQVLQAAGRKDEAKTWVETAMQDVEGHPQASEMQGFIGELAGELNQPGVGDMLDISFTSMEGEAIDLAEMKGKVVLVDFWATWCGPCIAELPNLKAAYQELHEEGFEIIGISLDEDEQALKSFLDKEEMPWPQEFSGKGWGSPLAEKFGIGSIPATFLVGKDGRVVAADLRGDALMAAVKDALAAD